MGTADLETFRSGGSLVGVVDAIVGVGSAVGALAAAVAISMAAAILLEVIAKHDARLLSALARLAATSARDRVLEQGRERLYILRLRNASAAAVALELLSFAAMSLQTRGHAALRTLRVGASRCGAYATSGIRVIERAAWSYTIVATLIGCVAFSSAFLVLTAFRGESEFRLLIAILPVCFGLGLCTTAWCEANRPVATQRHGSLVAMFGGAFLAGVSGVDSPAFGAVSVAAVYLSMRPVEAVARSLRRRFAPRRVLQIR